MTARTWGPCALLVIGAAVVVIVVVVVALVWHTMVHYTRRIKYKTQLPSKQQMHIPSAKAPH